MGRSKIKYNWEAFPLNDRDYYLKSPVAKFSLQNGDLD